MGTPATTGAIVELRVPAASRFLRLVRLTAAALASDISLTMDDIEDVRVATDELAASIIAHAHKHDVLEITLSAGTDNVEISGRCIAAAELPDAVIDSFAVELLDLITDAWSLDPHARSFRFGKSVTVPGDG